MQGGQISWSGDVLEIHEGELVWKLASLDSKWLTHYIYNLD